MAFGFFLNMERVALNIIDESISKMSNNNLFLCEGQEDETEINEDVLIKNLQPGAIAIVFISILYETALNTIISKRLECMDEDILKASLNMKLHMICFEYKIDFDEIKQDNRYSIVNEAVRVRNDIVHFKTNYLDEGSFIRGDVRIPMGKVKRSIAEIFTKKRIQQYYQGTLSFLEMLCDKCEFMLNKDCNILDCDARDVEYEFICEKRRPRNFFP